MELQSEVIPEMDGMGRAAVEVNQVQPGRTRFPSLKATQLLLLTGTKAGGG